MTLLRSGKGQNNFPSGIEMIFSLSSMLAFIQMMNSDGYCGIGLGEGTDIYYYSHTLAESEMHFI